MMIIDKKNLAVSPIVAVILMVAITVILAVIIYAWVSPIERRAEPHLELQLSPRGYPPLYSEWKIQVWRVNKDIRTPWNNITVIINVYEDKSDNNKTYSIKTDDEGACKFTYNIKQIHEFRATAKGYRDAFYRPKTHYIPAENVNHILELFKVSTFSIIIAALTAITGYNYHKNKRNIQYHKRSLPLYIITIVSILMVLLLFSGLYLCQKWNDLHTTFGYPINSLYHTLQLFSWIITIFIIIIAFMNIYLFYYNSRIRRI